MEIEEDNTLEELVIDSLKDASFYISESTNRRIETVIIDFGDYPIKTSDFSTLSQILAAPSDIEKLSAYFFSCKLNHSNFMQFLNSISRFSNITELE